MNFFVLALFHILLLIDLSSSHADDVSEDKKSKASRLSVEEILARDKTSLDIFWLKDKSLTDLENLPEPEELAGEIIENMEAGLDSFRQVLASLNA